MVRTVFSGERCDPWASCSIYILQLMLKIRVIFSRMTRGQVVQSNLVESDTWHSGHVSQLLLCWSQVQIPLGESGILTAGSVRVASGLVCSTSQSMSLLIYRRQVKSRRKPNYHAEIEAVNLSCQPKIHAFENPEDINRHTASQVKPSLQN